MFIQCPLVLSLLEYVLLVAFLLRRGFAIIEVHINCLFFFHLKPPEDNEEDDFKILSTENLLIVGRADDEFSSVEVHGKHAPHPRVVAI